MRGGTHASTYTNLSPHSHTYARDTCNFSSDSYVLVAFLRRNPDLCTLGSSTPLDVPLTGVARRIYLLFCVFLGHRVMRNHVGSQVGALSYPVSPQRGESPLYGSGTFASRLERMHARRTHASTYTNLSPHSHTYPRDRRKFSSDSDVLVAFLRRNPDLCTLGSSTPLDVPLRGVARRSSLLFCVCLGHRVMENHVGSQVEALSYPVSPQRGDSPVYGSGTFASRLERMHARGDTCKHLYQSLTTLTHISKGHTQVFI